MKVKCIRFEVRLRTVPQQAGGADPSDCSTRTYKQTIDLHIPVVVQMYSLNAAMRSSTRTPFRESERGERGRAAPGSRYSAVSIEAVLAATLLFLLSAADGFFTLAHAAVGVRELNPLMASVLARGPETFLSVKLSVSLVSAGIFAVFLPRCRWARPCLWSLVALYGAVCLYHLWYYF